MGRIADMKKLAIEKKKKRNRIILAVMVGVGVVIAIFVNPILGVIVGLTPLVVNAMIDAGKDITRGEEDLTKKIKEELAPEIIKIAMPDAEYLPYEGTPEEEYKLAEYIEPVFNYNSSDKIINSVKLEDGTEFEIEFTEVEFKQKEKDKNSFVGIFAQAKLSKDIRTKIKINREGTYEKGNIFKVNMEYDDFEEIFDVMSPNRSLTQKVIADSLMKRLVSLYETYSYMMEITIIKDKVYLRVESGPMIKNTKDGRIIDRIVMEKHYSMLKPLSDLMASIYAIIDRVEI